MDAIDKFKHDNLGYCSTVFRMLHACREDDMEAVIRIYNVSKLLVNVRKLSSGLK